MCHNEANSIMCGRFAFFGDNRETLAQLEAASDPPLLEDYNITPGRDIVVVRIWPETDVLEYGLLHWGLTPFWSKTGKTTTPLINARAEGIESKPSFRGPFRYRRCLIPVTGFYEWQKRAGANQPFFIRPKDGTLFLLAGIWDHWQGEHGQEIESCAIITTVPNTMMAKIHNRMPVILNPQDQQRWLAPQTTQNTLLKMLQPYPAKGMEAYPVPNLVNNSRNNGQECIAPRMEQQSLFPGQDIA